MGHGAVKPVAINISWLLCDFTEKNGGTRIFPGSHNVNVQPPNIFSIVSSGEKTNLSCPDVVM